MARLLFSTPDRDAAHAQMATTFAEHSMRLGRGGRLNLELDLAVTPRMVLGRMSYGAETIIEAPPMQSFYHVNLPLSGSSIVSQNGITRESRAGKAGVVFRPIGDLSITWGPDQQQYVIKLRKEELEAHATKLIGQPIDAIDFDLTFAMDDGAAQALLATASFVHAELIRPGGLSTMPFVRHDLESAIMTQVLTVVPSQLTTLLNPVDHKPHRAKIREVLELIDRDLTPELTTAELACKVGLSVRTLQAGFRDIVGTSPTSYLRDVRLDRVHHDLLCESGSSVTDIAMRWGFYHLGRFSQQYRNRFGALPSAVRNR